ncbi:MAG: PqqD family protein [Acidobacteria bacterium]|nr:PqqD family protein [Acidobacteriota bacterium]MBV9478732.1 PqqD family protein [Acidobacteriota bacterium]
MPETIEIDGTYVFRRTADVVCRKVGAESILVPVRNNVGNLDFVYTLSPVAARIWELADGTRSVDAIAAELCGEYDVDEATASADVVQTLTDLAAVSLVSEVVTSR